MADLRAEMSSFLKQDGKQASEKPAETKQVEKETDSQNEDQTEKDGSDTSDSSDSNVSTDDEGKKDKDEQGDEKKDDPKKPNRYQRLKVQRDQEIAKNKELTTQFNKAVKVANAWRAEAKAFELELNRVKEEAKAKGYQRTPEREKLFDFERDATVRQVEQEFDKQTLEEQQQAQAVQFKEALKERFLEEASDLSSKYGVDTKRILVAFHAERSAGNRISMEDVAKDLGELEGVRKNRNLTQRQRDVNSGAPRTMKPGTGVKVDYPRTTEGMKSFLKSQGLA